MYVKVTTTLLHRSSKVLFEFVIHSNLSDDVRSTSSDYSGSTEYTVISSPPPPSSASSSSTKNPFIDEENVQVATDYAAIKTSWTLRRLSERRDEFLDEQSIRYKMNLPSSVEHLLVSLLPHGMSTGLANLLILDRFSHLQPLLQIL